MGCFDSTCALTRTSIHVGDEVLYVQVRENAGKDTYELMNDMYRVQRAKEFRSAVQEKIEKDPAYGVFLDICEESSKYINHIAIGIYNDYGTIEGYDQDANLPEGEHEWWDYQFMVHREAAEILLGRELNADSLMEDLDDLVKSCFIARIQLFGHDLLGTQHFDHNELDLQEKVVEATQRMIQRKREYLEERDAEDDYEDQDET